MITTNFIIVQVAALFMLYIVTTSSAPREARLSEAEWESYHEVDHQGPGTYAFGYDIDDAANGNVQFRQEERLKNGTVIGSYGLVQPDGSVRVVHYIADHRGYRVTLDKTEKLPSSPPKLKRIFLPILGK